MAQNVTWPDGTQYTNVPFINLPKTGGGQARFTDVTDTTASASDVATDKYFYTASGVRTAGTNSGGGGGGASIGKKSLSNSDATATSISFTDLEGEPIAFFVRCTTSLSRSSSYRHYYVATMEYDGTSTKGNRWYRYNGQFSNITSGYSYTYSNGTLTLKSSGNQTTSPGSFYNGTYELVYIY